MKLRNTTNTNMAKNSIPSDIAKLSFEDALEQLEDIVRELEEGSGELDASIKAYERGAHLKYHCESKLKEAQKRVEKVILGSDGEARLEPVNLD
jgi:exodeoxyribonuclease VII small subunit